MSGLGAVLGCLSRQAMTVFSVFKAALDSAGHCHHVYVDHLLPNVASTDLIYRNTAPTPISVSVLWQGVPSTNILIRDQTPRKYRVTLRLSQPDGQPHILCPDGLLQAPTGRRKMP